MYGMLWSMGKCCVILRRIFTRAYFLDLKIANCDVENMNTVCNYKEKEEIW